MWILFLNSDGSVKSHQKISPLAGGYQATQLVNDLFGTSSSFLGDLDRNGTVELAVGIPQRDVPTIDAGAFEILSLTSTGWTAHQELITENTGGFTGTLGPAYVFGSSLAVLGDLNSDQHMDLAVGSARDAQVASEQGAVWIFDLTQQGTVGAQQRIDGTTTPLVDLIQNGERFGSAITVVGDVNGDHNPDLAVGSPFADEGGRDRGAVTILFLNNQRQVTGATRISDTQGNFHGGLENESFFGCALAAPGDLNADGTPDLCVGNFTAGDGGIMRGLFWLLYLNPDGTVKAWDKTGHGDPGITLINRSLFGGSLAWIDGFSSAHPKVLVVGTPGADDLQEDTGAIYLLEWNSCSSSLQGDFNGDCLVDYRDLTQSTFLGILDIAADWLSHD